MKQLIGKSVFLITILLLAACQGTGVGQNNDAEAQPTATPIPTAPAAARPTFVVQRGTVQEELEFTGRWQPRDQQELSFEIAGAIRAVNVRRGDTVSAGTLLIDYQITALEDNLASAELSLETALTNVTSGEDSSVDAVNNAVFALANAEISLDSTLGGVPWTNLESARIGVENAQITLDNAVRAFDEAVGHPENPPGAVDSAFNNLLQAQNGLLTSQNSYNSAAQNYNNYLFSIQQAENTVIQREIELQNAQEGGGNTSQIQAVNSAQLQVDQIKADIAQSSLYAPIDGVVLEVVVSPGDQVQAFDTVLTLAIPEPKEAIANLAFNDTQRLSVGMVGVCQLINQPDSAVQCVIRQIPLSNRDADQTVRVAASLENIPEGQLVEIDMPLDVRENVLWLPPEAIRTFQNRTFVVIQTDDGQQVVDVQLGLQTDDRVEIESGVSDGDIIVGP